MTQPHFLTVMLLTLAQPPAAARETAAGTSKTTWVAARSTAEPSDPTTFDTADLATPAEASSTGRHWKVTRVEVAAPSPVPGGAPITRAEVRVVRGDGRTPVSVGEGLTELGMEQRLVERARPPVDTLANLRDTVGRSAVMAAGGGILGVGVLAVLGGGVLWTLSLLGQTGPLKQPAVQVVVREGLFILLSGVVGIAVGGFTLAVTAAAWAWRYFQGPPPPPASTVQALGASLGWEEEEAKAVVASHNANVDASSRAASVGPESASPPVAKAPEVKPAQPAAAPRPAAPEEPEPPPPPPRRKRPRAGGRN